ncbi:MAG: SH3 domain-containing protein [Bacteroidales bacterium]|nr:SH3 domain-containing protein [Bacteroidales bacterium]
MKKLLLFFVLIFTCLSEVCFAYGENTSSSNQTRTVTLPAKYVVNTQRLNVRAGNSTRYESMGQLYRGDTIVVYYITENNWGRITSDEYSQRAYVSLNYLSYVAPEEEIVEQEVETQSRSGVSSFFHTIWKIIKYIVIIALIILCICFIRYIFQFIITVSLMAGICALVTHLLFSNVMVGAVIGSAVGVFMALQIIAEEEGGSISDVFYYLYMIFGFPSYFFNWLEITLQKPWRMFLKSDWGLSDSGREDCRMVFEILQWILFVAITPLRFVNAVYFNIIIYVLSSWYNLWAEVFIPSDDDEGGDGLGNWFIFLPIRIIKYPLYHGTLTLIEGIVWTVVDLFIPTITLYHGTDGKAADAITCEKNRNGFRANNYYWKQGTFSSSEDGWAGRGAYFASCRRTALAYANDPYRCSDENPTIIVCRVSWGRNINMNLAPHRVSSQTGYGGNHNIITSYGLNNNFVSGEWWNVQHDYWEYCMYDWQNKYNHPWRIRPIYVFNCRTGILYRTKGGMSHWLFRKEVWDEIEEFFD